MTVKEWTEYAKAWTYGKGKNRDLNGANLEGANLKDAKLQY